MEVAQYRQLWDITVEGRTCPILSVSSRNPTFQVMLACKGSAAARRPCLLHLRAPLTASKACLRPFGDAYPTLCPPFCVSSKIRTDCDGRSSPVGMKTSYGCVS